MSETIRNDQRPRQKNDSTQLMQRTTSNLSKGLSSSKVSLNSSGSSKQHSPIKAQLPNISQTSRNKISFNNSQSSLTLRSDPLNDSQKQELLNDLNLINDDIYQLNTIINTTLKNNQNDENQKIDIKKQLKIYTQITKRLEKHHVLPESLNISRVCTKMTSKPYMKFYLQKNGTHDSDREKPSSMMSNIVVKKLQKNQQKLLFGMMDADEQEEQNLDLNNNTLIHLGQAPKGSVQVTEEGDEPEGKKVKKQTVREQLEILLERRKSKSFKKERPNPNVYQNMTIDRDNTGIDFFATQRQASQSVAEPYHTDDQQQSRSQKSLKSEKSLPEIRIFPPNKSNTKMKVSINQSPTLIKIKKCCDIVESSEISSPNSIKQMEAQQIKECIAKTLNQVKNLSILISIMQQYKKKQKILDANPLLQDLPEEDQKLFEEGKQPKLSHIRNLPLKQKLESIDLYNIDPQSVLSELEMNICKINNHLSIPDKIKMTNLRNLLHKQTKKVNKWISTSLKGTYQFEFDYFMQNDKSIVDKNSIQFQAIEQQKNDRKRLNENLEYSGFIDPNMRAIEMSDQKVINDICKKYQFKKAQLVPIYNQKQQDAQIENVAKLHEVLMKKQEEVEKKIRAGKEKQYNKWKAINEDYKMRQATQAQNTQQKTKNSTSKSFTPNSTKPVQSQLQQNSLATTKYDGVEDSERKTILSEKFKNYFREKYDLIESTRLVKDLDNEICAQNKLLKTVTRDIDEFEYRKQKKKNGEVDKDQDSSLPDDFYVKSGKSKMFSKNIAIWKQQEIYNDLHGDFDNFKKKYKILQK